MAEIYFNDTRRWVGSEMKCTLRRTERQSRLLGRESDRPKNTRSGIGLLGTICDVLGLRNGL